MCIDNIHRICILVFMNLNYTNHSLARIQQRGIPKQAIELIVEFGKSFQSHESKKYVISKKISRKLKQNHKFMKYEKNIRNTCVVLNDANGGTVITVYKINGRLLWN